MLRKGCLSISIGDILFIGSKSKICSNKSIKLASLSSPKHSYFLSIRGIFFNNYYCLARIFLFSRPCTPKRPVPMIDFPLTVIILLLRESHRGNPVRISSNIEPMDHTSYDQGWSLRHKFYEFVPLA